MWTLIQLFPHLSTTNAFTHNINNKKFMSRSSSLIQIEFKLAKYINSSDGFAVMLTMIINSIRAKKKLKTSWTIFAYNHY